MAAGNQQALYGALVQALADYNRVTTIGNQLIILPTRNAVQALGGGRAPRRGPGRGGRNAGRGRGGGGRGGGMVRQAFALPAAVPNIGTVEHVQAQALAIGLVPLQLNAGRLNAVNPTVTPADIGMDAVVWNQIPFNRNPAILQLHGTHIRVLLAFAVDFATWVDNCRTRNALAVGVTIRQLPNELHRVVLDTTQPVGRRFTALRDRAIFEVLRSLRADMGSTTTNLVVGHPNFVPLNVCRSFGQALAAWAAGATVLDDLDEEYYRVYDAAVQANTAVVGGGGPVHDVGQGLVVDHGMNVATLEIDRGPTVNAISGRLSTLMGDAARV